MGAVAMGEVWVVARLNPDRTAYVVNGAYASKAKAIAACRVPEDAVVRFEIDADMTDIEDPEPYDVTYPLREK